MKPAAASPAPSPPPSEPPVVEDYVAEVEDKRRFDTERQRLDATRPLTIREAACVLAGLQRLARIANGGR
jgi:hypothetical protein